MTLLNEAQLFRKAFGQEMLDNISNAGFIKKRLWDMQVGLIAEEAKEFSQAAEDVFEDPESLKQSH